LFSVACDKIKAVTGERTTTVVKPNVMMKAPDFSLVRHDGQDFGSKDLEGTVYVVNFFFTSCSTICPKIMSAMGKLRKKFADAKLDVNLVSITVDPETDTPKVLNERRKTYGAVADNWHFMWGPRPKLRAVIFDGFKTILGDKETRVVDDLEIMDIGHGGKIILVDQMGQVRGHYELTPQGTDELFRAARVLIKYGP